MAAGESSVVDGSDGRGERIRALLGTATLYLLGNVLYRGAAYLPIPLYARHLGPEEFGLWGLLQTIQVVMLVLVDGGVSRAAARFYFDHATPFDQTMFLAKVLTLRLVTSIVFAGLVGATAAMLWHQLTNARVPLTPYCALVTGTVLFDSMTLLIGTLLRIQQRAMPFFLIRVGQAFLQVVFSIFFLLALDAGVVGVFWGQFLGALVVGCVALGGYTIANGRWLLPSLPEIAPLFAYGAPMVFHELAWWARNMADPLVLVQSVTPAMLGAYSLGYSAGMMLSLLINSVDLSYGPHFYATMRESPDPRAELTQQALHFIAILGVVVVGVALFFGDAITLLGGNLFAGAAEVAAVVVAAYFFHGLYVCFVKPIFYAKHTRPVLALTVPTTIVAVLVNIVLVPRYGMMVAAWTTLLSFVAIAGGVLFIAQRVDRFPYPLGRIGLYVALVVVTAIFGTTAVSAITSSEALRVIAPLKALVCGTVACISWILLLRSGPGAGLARA